MSIVNDLARETGLSVRGVRRLITTAPKRYKVYPIKKRTGGVRVIAQPALEIKVLQKIVMMRVFAQMPVHESAYAYVKGKSIRNNALRHANSTFILKMDFRNFFNSIVPVDLERVLRSHSVNGISTADYEDIYKISFWGAGAVEPRCLSIGAPSSPMISNIIMYEIDRSAFELATRYNVTYTRYADDITVSTQGEREKLLKFEKGFANIIARSSLNLEFNTEKRGLYGRGDRRMVTGLIITPTGSVSIGRERKRIIRAALHRLYVGEKSDDLIMYCKGMLAFIVSAEPTFLRSLYKAYGRDFIGMILKSPQIGFYQSDEK